jgi:hypothetical protein
MNARERRRLRFAEAAVGTTPAWYARKCAAWQRAVRAGEITPGESARELAYWHLVWFTTQPPRSASWL